MFKIIEDSNCFKDRFGNKTLFDIAIDKENKVIHILDIGRVATSVTNAIDGLRYFILGEYGLDGKLDDWRWLLYGTDGVISEFSDQGFTHIRFTGLQPLDDFKSMMERIWC